MWLKKEKVIEELKELVSNYPEIEFLALIGSLARKGYSAHDIDVAVKVTNGFNKYGILAELIAEMSKRLNVPEDRIDIIDLDRADPEIKAEVIKGSVIVVDKGYYNDLVKEVEDIFKEYSEYRELSIKEWLESNDPTSINVSMLKRRLDFIRSEINFLKERVLNRSPEEVKDSPLLSRVLERSYQLIVEAIIDVSRHIVSSMGWGPCFTSSCYIEELAEHNIITKELADEIVKRVRLRNIIVHRYLDIDYDELYNDIKKLIEVAGEFEKHIVDFIRRRSRKQL